MMKQQTMKTFNQFGEDRMKYYKQSNVNIIECSPDEFSIVLKSEHKKNLKESTYTNANFFGNFSEKGQKFTLPVGQIGRAHV